MSRGYGVQQDDQALKLLFDAAVWAESAPLAALSHALHCPDSPLAVIRNCLSGSQEDNRYERGRVGKRRRSAGSGVFLMRHHHRQTEQK